MSGFRTTFEYLKGLNIASALGTMLRSRMAIGKGRLNFANTWKPWNSSFLEFTRKKAMSDKKWAKNNRYDEGCWGFPYLKIKKVYWCLGCWFLFFGFMVLCFMVVWFSGCMVLWLYGLMVCWFWGFMVLWCRGFMVLWFQKITKLPFHVSGRYRSHIQDFQDFTERIFIIIRCPPFRKLSTCLIPEILRFIKLICFKSVPGMFLDLF